MRFVPKYSGPLNAYLKDLSGHNFRISQRINCRPTDREHNRPDPRERTHCVLQVPTQLVRWGPSFSTIRNNNLSPYSPTTGNSSLPNVMRPSQSSRWWKNKTLYACARKEGKGERIATTSKKPNKMGPKVLMTTMILTKRTV